MFSGVRNVIFNIRLRGWSYIKKYTKFAAAISVITSACGLGVYKTHRNLNKVIANSVLEREHSGRPEYLYVNDPSYEERIRQHLEEEGAWSPGPFLGRWVSLIRQGIWRRLIHISCNGSAADRCKALNHLSSIKHLKEWEIIWLSQRLDAKSAVWLGRHGGKYGWRLAGTVPPLPNSAYSSSFLSILTHLASLSGLDRSCKCIDAFLQEHSDINQDEQRLVEDEISARKHQQIDLNAELLTNLETLLHFFDMTKRPILEKSMCSAEEEFVNKGGLVYIAQAAKSSERPLKLAAARLLLKLSHFPQLLPQFHKAGLIASLSSWINEDKMDAELSCMAAGALAGFEDGINEEKYLKELYDPAVQLLYPIHHTKKTIKLDVIFIHGLLGEPFITWRQRDKIDELMKPLLNFNIFTDVLDEKYQILLRDIPKDYQRDETYINTYIKKYGHEPYIFDIEQQDLLSHTQCWPKDWLPFDCPNIRVLGVSYDTMMMEWSSGCKGLGDTAHRAHILKAALQEAGVGSRPLVWIAHSMGGLLVKHMLVQSLEANNDIEKGMAVNTKGIIFFSTPHHGSRAAHNLIWPSKEVQDLRQDSKILGDLHKKWLSGKWHSICIAESQSTPLFPGLSLHLVPPDSANDNSGPFYTLPLNHLDICKPATRYSFIYRTVVRMIQHAKKEKCGEEGCIECSYFNKTYYWLNLKEKIFNIWYTYVMH